jgi:hypothetical protein
LSTRKFGFRRIYYFTHEIALRTEIGGSGIGGNRYALVDVIDSAARKADELQCEIQKDAAASRFGKFESLSIAY